MSSFPPRLDSLSELTRRVHGRAVYRSLSLRSRILSILAQLQSLCVHLSLNDETSPGEAGEWRRRSEAYRSELDKLRDGNSRVQEEEKDGWDWRRVIEIVRVLEELI